MENEKAILNDAKSAAIRVEFLNTKEELFLYPALMCGTGIRFFI